MARPYRNTPRAHAESLAQLSESYAQLATQHREFANTVTQGKHDEAITRDRFTNWIFRLVKLAAGAEQLLALEIELARKHGATWSEIGDALGVSRQAAHDRFSKPERRNKSRKISQLNQAQWTDAYRYVQEEQAAGEGYLPPNRRLRSQPKRTGNSSAG